MDAEFAGLVGGGGNDAAGARVADDEGFAAKRGIIEDFHGREKCVHVRMNHFQTGVKAIAVHGSLPSQRIVPDSPIGSRSRSDGEKK